MSETRKAHIAVLLTNFFFAANLSLVKHISPSLVGAFGVNFFRVGIALLLFWILWPSPAEMQALIKKISPAL